MSYKSRLIKMAIKLTPNKMVVWVANIVLKGVAELTDFNFDIDTRKVYVQTLLCGESEPIEVWVDGFAIERDGESYTFIIQQAQSNKLWLGNLLSRVVGKAWKIPVIPQLAPHIGLIAEVFKAERPEQEQEQEQE
ncbi:MAG: hypothetical protein CTY16_01540 [Methylobacter sp.]|nr:MAG: hypothetical protein CTY16_01540 [Methylobacter sp.]